MTYTWTPFDPFAKNNPILKTDSYKHSHYLQDPEGTSEKFAYIESRGGPLPYTLFVGLQAVLMEHFSKPVNMAHVDAAERFLAKHMPGLAFNRAGWERIVYQHGGHLPLEIRALPEGTIAPTHTPLVTLRNTDPTMPWLVSFIETVILRLWYPTTVATISRSIKDILVPAMTKSCDDLSKLPFMLHDFGARGVSSEESAALGGMAHLVNFMGTDTISGLIAAWEFYGADVCGYSIPAAEHSTITVWGQENDGERRAYENMIDQFAGPNKLYAVVSDSYDLFNAVGNLWGVVLKEKVLASGGTLVVRPDSGDPKTIVMATLESLGQSYGYTLNGKGFKVLNTVRVIQGDGVNPVSIREIVDAMLDAGWSLDNIAFGMGGALLQKVDRDTFKFAMKTSAVKINGMWSGVNKDPKTDPGKASKKGIMTVVADPDGTLRTVFVKSVEALDLEGNVMPVVWRDGTLLIKHHFFDIRDRSEL